MALDKTLLKKLSILYVEDDETIRTELSSLLSNFFNEVFIASDGLEGLNVYKNNKKKIDLIISDITMPKMSGIDMVKEIREFDNEIAIIFATAYSDKEFLIDSIKLKIYNYIIKPIDIRGLLASIGELAQTLHTKEIIDNKNKELAEFKEAIDASSIVIKTDTHMKITYVNSHFCKVTGYSSDELIGKNFLHLKHQDSDKSIYNNMYENVLNNKMWNGKLKQVTKEGVVFIVDSYMITSHDEDGNIVGEHKGYMHYTIGKRRGFTVHGAHDPHFVTKLNPKDNTIVVGKKTALEINEVEVKNLNMFIDKKEFNCTVKLRYRSVSVPCKVKIENNDTAYIVLEEPAFGVAAGQLAVFYENEKVLGSAWIKNTK